MKIKIGVSLQDGIKDNRLQINLVYSFIMLIIIFKIRLHSLSLTKWAKYFLNRSFRFASKHSSFWEVKIGEKM